VAQISDELDALLRSCESEVGNHAAEISEQLQARAKLRTGEENRPTGFSRASALRAGFSAGGAGFSVGPPASLNEAQREGAIANPRADTIAVHMISDVGQASQLLSEFGSHPRLLTLAADVLDGTALRQDGQQHMLQTVNQAHFKAPGGE